MFKLTSKRKRQGDFVINSLKEQRKVNIGVRYNKQIAHFTDRKLPCSLNYCNAYLYLEGRSTVDLRSLCNTTVGKDRPRSLDVKVSSSVLLPVRHF